MSQLVLRTIAERVTLLQSEGRNEEALKLLLAGAEHGAAMEEGRKRMAAAMGTPEILEAPDARRQIKHKGKWKASQTALAWAGGA